MIKFFRNSGNKPVWYLSAAVVIILLFAIIGKKQGWIGKSNKIKVSTEKVAYRTITETVSASGKIFPEVEVKISSDVSGEIIELLVEEGDSVFPGDKLVGINPDIYIDIVERAKASVDNSKANLASSKARLSQAKAYFEKAESDYQRNEKLHKDKVISDSEFETSLANYKSASADYEGAKQSVKGGSFLVKSMEASFKEAGKNLRKTTIFSPIQGIVSKLNVEKGERVVGTLQMTGTEIMRIADFKNMEARVNVSENDVLSVLVGDEVDIEIDAYSDRIFEGEVSQVASSASDENLLTSERVTNFTVRIRVLSKSYKDLLEKNSFPFRPGMSASVEIKTEKQDSVLTIPIQAVTTREERDTVDQSGVDKKVDKNKQSIQKKNEKKLEEVVFVCEDGKVIMEVVTTGIQNDTYIQILSGLSDGIEVVAAPYSAISRKLEDGDDVEKVTKSDLYKKDN